MRFALVVLAAVVVPGVALDFAPCAAFAALVPRTPVTAPVPPEGDLDAGLARVVELLAADDADDRARAHAALHDALVACRDAAARSRDDRAAPRLARELAERRDELRDLARRTAFAATYEEPALERILGGDHVDWNPRTRRLEIEYSRASPRAEEPRDGAAGGSDFHPLGFEEHHGVLVSSVPFDGPCQLELHGRAPRDFVRDPPPALWLLADDERSFEMWFTWPSTHERSVGKWTQGKAQVWRLGQPTLLARDRTPGGKYGLGFDEPYVLKLRVTRSALVGSLNGFGMLKAGKRRGGYGRLGFEHCPDVERVRLSGRVERATVAGFLRRRWEDDLARHLEEPPAPDAALLPAWLVEAPPETPEAEPASELRFRATSPRGDG